MKTFKVWVPDALLQERELPTSAKLLWLVLAYHRADHGPTPFPRPGQLQSLSGLSRHTLTRGLTQLRAAGWLVAGPDYFPLQVPTSGSLHPRTSHALSGQKPVGQSRAHIPGELLLDHRVGPQPTLLYAHLQHTPEYRNSGGHFHYTQLMDQTNLSRNTLKLGVRTLTEAGWLTTSQNNRFAPVRFTLRNPWAERHQAELAQAQRRLRRAPFLGEALMREFLTVLVDRDDYHDDASPGYLNNPYTDEKMQIDRIYPPRRGL